jgi:hypothetical protein
LVVWFISASVRSSTKVTQGKLFEHSSLNFMSKRKRVVGSGGGGGVVGGGGGGIRTDVAFNPFTDKFRDEWWVNSHPLNASTCLKYFERATKHYSTASLNHQITYGGVATAAADTMGGIWYKCERTHDAPPDPVTGRPCFPLVVLSESERQPDRPREDDELRAMYYMLDGNILRCPPLHDVLRARLLKAAQHIDDAFAFLQEKRAFNLVEGFGWETEDGAGTAAAAAAPSGGKKKAAAGTKHVARKSPSGARGRKRQKK